MFKQVFTSAVIAGTAVMGTSPAGADTAFTAPQGTTAAAKARLAKMSPNERDAFIKKNLVASISETEQTHRVTATSLLPSALSSVKTHSARPGEKCYMRSATAKGKNALGGTLYSYTHVGAWCVKNGRVTQSAKYQAYANTDAPGWRGEVGRSWSGILYNQGRSATQFKFTLGAWGVDVQHVSPCAQVDGKANSGSTTRWTCSLS